jgi:hypothetical protein
LNNPTSSVANPLTVDMVQTWFESNYGKSKTISYPHPQTNSFGGDSTVQDFYFNQIFDITPTWTQAEISTYLSVNSIVIVPVKPIAFLDAKKQEYVFVCFRNKQGQIDGRLQVYQPTYAYQKSHQTYDVQDFSGFMLQICLDGKVKRIFSYENGKFLTQIIASPNPNLGGNNLNGRSVICKGCYTDDPTSTWWHDVYCWFCELGSGTGDTGGANRLGETGENSLSTVGSSLDYGSNNAWPTNETNTGSSTSGGSGLSLSAQITNGFFNTRAVVIAKLLEVGYSNDELSDLSTPALKALLTTWAKYEGAGFSPSAYSALRADEVLFAQVDGFLNNESFSANTVRIVKHYLSNSNESILFVDNYGGPSFEVNPIKYLKCFISRPNSIYKVSVCVAQPKENSRNVNIGLDAGHTFLTLEQSFNGETVRRSIGFYPASDWQVVTTTPNQPARYANNDLKGYNVSISSNLSETQFLGIVNNIRNYSTNGYNYDLHKFNCSTFAVNAVEGFGFNLPRTEDNFSKGKGMTPSNLAEDIRVMTLQPGQTRDVSSGKKTPLLNSSSSDCN